MMENTVYTPEQLGSVLKGFRNGKNLSQKLRQGYRLLYWQRTEEKIP